MGHRANFAIIQGGQTSLYYSGWGAVTLVSKLFYGAEPAIRHIEDSEPTEALLDDSYCEGAAVVDRDALRLLFFAGFTDHFPGLRRYLLPLIRHNWPGWEVRWADRGIVDVAIALGIDPDAVRDKVGASWEVRKAEPGVRPEFVSTLITVGFAEDAVDYGSEESLRELLAWGPELIERLPGCTRVPLREDGELEGGAVLDPARREIWAWEITTADECDYDRIADRWPGWSVQLHHGGLRQHLRLTGRDPSLVDLGVEEALRQIVMLLSGNLSFDLTQALTSILEGGDPADVQVGRGFFRADRPDFDTDAKRAILGRAVAALRAGAIQPDP